MSRPLDRLKGLERRAGLEGAPTPVTIEPDDGPMVGVDTWEAVGRRVIFINFIVDGVFHATAFWEGDRPEPSFDISRPIAATDRMRMLEMGSFGSEREKRDLVSCLYYGLSEWPAALARAGFVLSITEEMRELQAEALESHHRNQKFETQRAFENHFLRLRGTGVFDAGEWTEGSTPEERAAAYRRECGITGGQ